MKKIVFSILLMAASLDAFDEINPVSSYGWLDQYSMDSYHSYVGNEACVPTSSTNGMTYLQNVANQVFGQSLTGSSYADWIATDNYLIDVMGTTPVDGTYYYQFVYALNTYITQTKGFSEVRFSGMFPSSIWYPSGGYSQPTYITSGKPTIDFLTNAVAAGSAVLISIEYSGGGGHEILANGINWDPDTQQGLLYFVDPLDPSQNYSPEVPLGPVKQTVGTLELNDSGNLVLHYNQYEGRLPYTGSYEETEVTLLGSLSVGGGAFVPFSQLTSGNAQSVAEGFDIVDPTTSDIFPILAILNTSESVESAFQQMDPSIFSSVLLNEQVVAIQTRHMLTRNIWQYRKPCIQEINNSCFRLWGTPFGANIHQDNLGLHSGYKSRIRGGLGAIDYFLTDSFLVGVGGVYTKANITWNEANADANMRTQGAFLYGTWFKPGFWLDASFGYFNNRVTAMRSLTISSPIPFIAPFSDTYRHTNNSSVYLGHLGGNYEVWETTWQKLNFVVWPFANLDYLYAYQPAFEEKGGTLALTVLSNEMQLLQPEIGLGCSIFMPTASNYTPFVHATFSYGQEIRFGGKNTKAYFTGTPASQFTVSGLYPKHGIVSPGLIIGVRSPDDLFTLDVSYMGTFGSHSSLNEVTGEVSLAF